MQNHLFAKWQLSYPRLYLRSWIHNRKRKGVSNPDAFVRSTKVLH